MLLLPYENWNHCYPNSWAFSHGQKTNHFFFFNFAVSLKKRLCPTSPCRLPSTLGTASPPAAHPVPHLRTPQVISILCSFSHKWPAVFPPDQGRRRKEGNCMYVLLPCLPLSFYWVLTNCCLFLQCPQAK